MPSYAAQSKGRDTKTGGCKITGRLHYPQWVVDMLVVPKKNGKIRVCMDYR
jgi:hypothetical protein